MVAEAVVKDRARNLEGLLDGISVVDADTHVSEWYDLWTSRASPKFKNRVPQMRELDGKLEWVIDGQSLGKNGASSTVLKDGTKLRGLTFRGLRLEDVHPASYDVKARVKFMDAEGIAAQIAYPNLLGFGGQKAMRTDEELRNVSVTIFNDAMAEMQADSGNRIYPMAMMPWWDVKFAAKEAERCAAMGLRGINMNSDPHHHGLPTLGEPHWNDLWDVCVDKSLPVNFHIGASDESLSWFGAGLWPGHSDEIQLAYGSLMLITGNMRVLANIFLSGFLDRYPDLKIVSVESGVGWIPFLLESLEYQLYEAKAQFKSTPREMFKRQVYACSWFERSNIVHSMRDLGIDNVMFETDFPHPTCLYPNPLSYIKEGLMEMTKEERHKMLGGNARKLYNLDLPSQVQNRESVRA